MDAQFLAALIDIVKQREETRRRNALLDFSSVPHEVYREFSAVFDDQESTDEIERLWSKYVENNDLAKLRTKLEAFFEPKFQELRESPVCDARTLFAKQRPKTEMAVEEWVKQGRKPFATRDFVSFNGAFDATKMCAAIVGATQAQAQAQAQAESQAKAQAESQAKSQSEMQAKAQAESQAKSQSEMQAKSQSEMQAKAQAESQAKSQSEMQAKAQAESQAKSQSEMQAKAQAESQAKSQSEMQAKAQAQPQPGGQKQQPQVDSQEQPEQEETKKPAETVEEAITTLATATGETETNHEEVVGLFKGLKSDEKEAELVELEKAVNDAIAAAIAGDKGSITEKWVQADRDLESFTKNIHIDTVRVESAQRSLELATIVLQEATAATEGTISGDEARAVFDRAKTLAEVEKARFSREVEVALQERAERKAASQSMFADAKRAAQEVVANWEKALEKSKLAEIASEQLAAAELKTHFDASLDAAFNIAGTFLIQEGSADETQHAVDLLSVFAQTQPGDQEKQLRAMEASVWASNVRAKMDDHQRILEQTINLLMTNVEKLAKPAAVYRVWRDDFDAKFAQYAVARCKARMVELTELAEYAVVDFDVTKPETGAVKIHHAHNLRKYKETLQKLEHLYEYLINLSRVEMDIPNDIHLQVFSKAFAIFSIKRLYGAEKLKTSLDGDVVIAQAIQKYVADLLALHPTEASLIACAQAALDMIQTCAQLKNDAQAAFDSEELFQKEYVLAFEHVNESTEFLREKSSDLRKAARKVFDDFISNEQVKGYSMAVAEILDTDLIAELSKWSDREPVLCQRADAIAVTIAAIEQQRDAARQKLREAFGKLFPKTDESKKCAMGEVQFESHKARVKLPTKLLPNCMNNEFFKTVAGQADRNCVVPVPQEELQKFLEVCFDVKF